MDGGGGGGVKVESFLEPVFYFPVCFFAGFC